MRLEQEMDALCCTMSCKTMWEALTAIGTMFTGAVIFVTVLVGARQLRVMNQQLQQLQQSTQLEGTMKVFEIFRSQKFREATHFVFAEFAQRMQDEKFRADAGRLRGVDENVHKERDVMRTYEEIGTYIRHVQLNGDPIYDLHGPLIIGAWTRLLEVVKRQREAYGGTELWENFEYLYTQAQKYHDTHFPRA